MTESNFCKVVGAVLVGLFVFISWSNESRAEKSIYHEIYYPEGGGQFPALIILHTSGGFNTIKNKIERYVQAGYAVYAPDFFKKHKLSFKNRFDTFKKYRESIESELFDVIEIMKKDNKVDKKNIFAVGYSNGGFWASFLAAEEKVNAGVSYYGVWFYPDHDGYPAKYFSINSNPVLVLHGKKETVQKLSRVKPQWTKAKKLGGRLTINVYEEVGHSFDCKPCKKDGFNLQVTKDAFSQTIYFFNKYKK